MIDFENQNSSKMFGKGTPIVNSTNIYEGVGDTGTAIVMNIEFNQEQQQLEQKTRPGGDLQKASKKKKNTAGGGKPKKK